MPEKTETIVTLKIQEQDHDWATAEQKRIKRSEGRKPTQAELFQRLRSAYEATSKPESPPKTSVTQYPDWTKEAHDLLQLILDRDAKAADWIIGNLKMFAEAIRSRAGKPGGRRRAS